MTLAPNCGIPLGDWYGDTALLLSSTVAPATPAAHRADAHVASDASASASDVDDFGASMRADAMAYVAELYAAGNIGLVPPPPRRATATGGVYAAISEESDGDEVSARWVHIMGRVRARATTMRCSDVRRARAPATAFRAI
jgi:hypothetical protein